MRRLFLSIILVVGIVFNADAQFRTDKMAGNSRNSQLGPPGSEVNSGVTDSDNNQVVTDSTQGFSIKRMVRGFTRKDTLELGYLALGTAVLPGSAQIYNRQYWKLPIVYGGIGAGIAGGIAFNKKFHETGDDKYKTLRTASYIGAGLFYWGQVLDGVVSYKTDITVKKPVAAKATLYSALLPGLGQAYNGDWWKIPIWYGGFAACGYFYHQNDMNYRRFKYIYDVDNNKESSGYIGGITASQAEWYKTTYRRYRDYSILAFVLVYALNVIDANVFAHMHDFDVSDNIASLEVSPTVITPLNAQYACQSPASGSTAMGLNFKFTF